MDWVPGLRKIAATVNLTNLPRLFNLQLGLLAATVLRSHSFHNLPSLPVGTLRQQPYRTRWLSQNR